MFRQYVSWTSKGVHRFHQRRRVAARGRDQLEMLKNGDGFFKGLKRSVGSWRFWFSKRKMEMIWLVKVLEMEFRQSGECIDST